MLLISLCFLVSFLSPKVSVVVKKLPDSYKFFNDLRCFDENIALCRFSLEDELMDDFFSLYGFL